ncbi:MAG TPA: hypothetical protein VFR35_09725 [Actinoplanes sp.]|nr:hypothetical protein [Actinoplanes sp.]
MSDEVTSRHPPAWLLRVINPLLRRLLPSALGARMPQGLLRVAGRRTGRRYEIPVGVWPVKEGLVVFTDAPWLQNFRGGADAELVHRGQAQPVHGEVVEDASRIGPWLRGVLASGKARQVGLSVTQGHTISDEEAAAVRKALLLTATSSVS